jgi:exosortase
LAGIVASDSSDNVVGSEDHGLLFPLKRYWKGLLVALLIASLYAEVVLSWLLDWWQDESYSHGFLAAAIALYIAWRQRKGTLALPPAPSAKGLWVTAFALLLFLVGRLGAEFFTTRMSLILLICGLTWTFWGTPRLRRIAFPLLLLASVVPPPVIVYNKLSAPLQLLASNIATQIAQALGASVYRDGNVIQLANTSLGVAEACSGLRSLASLTVGALLLGYVEQLRTTTRVLIFFMAIPIAVLFNVLRVSGTALLAEQNPELAMGYYHLLSGWLVFVAGFGTLFVSMKALRYILDRKRVPAE